MKIIKFFIEEETAAGFFSARKKVPDWYKRASLHLESDKKRTSFKGCVPFLDALTAGYVFTTPTDLRVTQTASGPYIEWASAAGVDPVELRPLETTHGMPVPAGHSELPFVFYSPIALKMPKGYSCLITHPLNRFDLPFTSTSAVVDNDKIPLTFGKLPFFIKKDFEGIIPCGTPYAQIIPIKRKFFKAVKSKKLQKENKLTLVQSRARFSGWYKKNVKIQKTYNDLTDI
jgi:hypothetical protein